MKNLNIGLISLLAVIALLFGILPVFAGESPDGANLNGARNAYITKNGVNSQKSAVTSTYLPMTVQAGEPLVFALSAADPDNNQLIYSAANLPPGATFDPLTGTFSWTPSSGQAGVYPGIHFEVSDGELTDSEDITITVIASPDATPKSGAVVFSITGLSINPSKVNAGKKVNIRATVTNSGNAAGDYEAVLKINGVIEAINLVTVPAGSSVIVSFTSVQDDPGVYEVDVNGLTGSFEVNSLKGSDGSGGQGGSHGRKA
jgi:hypothetical protein